MTAREYKAIANENAQGGRYDRAQVYATLYLAEQVAELVQLVKPAFKPSVTFDPPPVDPPKRVRRGWW